ncbi:MAG TPA: hypothetical protein VFJ97_01660 [Dermatophilaceae bacterium]|nr:hypothetical protein [Dermatophilaceae bacterium]
MNTKRLFCAVLGHRWRRTRRDQTDLLVCRRCDRTTGLDEERHGAQAAGDFGIGGGGAI